MEKPDKHALDCLNYFKNMFAKCEGVVESSVFNVIWKWMVCYNLAQCDRGQTCLKYNSSVAAIIDHL